MTSLDLGEICWKWSTSVSVTFCKHCLSRKSITRWSCKFLMTKGISDMMANHPLTVLPLIATTIPNITLHTVLKNETWCRFRFKQFLCVLWFLLQQKSPWLSFSLFLDLRLWLERSYKFRIVHLFVWNFSLELFLWSSVRL